MTTTTNKNQIASKIKRGVNFTTSGSNQVVVVQKNGVIRAALLSKRKEGSTKS